MEIPADANVVNPPAPTIRANVGICGMISISVVLHIDDLS